MARLADVQSCVRYGAQITNPSTTTAIPKGFNTIQDSVFYLPAAIPASGSGAAIIECGRMANADKDTAAAIAVGEALYWDEANERLTTTPGALQYCGVATSAATAAATKLPHFKFENS